MPKTVEAKPGTLFTPQFDRFFRTHETQRWSLSGINFGAIDKTKLTKDHVDALHAAMLVESHNPVYTLVLLDMFRHDHEMTSFLVTWGYEEFKHYAVLKSYLEASGMVDKGELTAELDQTRAGPWGEEERKFSRVRSFTYTMLQEQVTGQFYQKFSDGVEEPVLRDILRLVSGDEYRHCQYYLEKGREELAKDKRGMREVDEVWLTFNMPGPTFIPDYDKYLAAMGKVVPRGPDNYKQILSKVAQLIGPLHMAELALDHSYRQKMQDKWDFDLGEIARDIIKPRLPSFSLPSFQ